MAKSSSASWRSSKSLLIFTVTLGLFTENFLYGFIVPLLPYMIEVRLGLPASYTQRTTTELLSFMGVVSIISAPIIAHLADLSASRKIPLLLSLLGCIAGTLLVASTISLPVIYAGRVLQGIAGTGTWIIGFAILTDAAGGKNLGRTLSLAGSFLSAGIVLGPAGGGIFLEVFGYWGAWSLPLALLAICLVTRLVTIDEIVPSKREESLSSGGGQDVETAPLLSTATEDSKAKSKVTTKPGFYKIVLTDLTVWAAMLNVIAFSLVLTGFDATLPLHLRDTFGWGPAPIGAIFLSLQIPGMLLGPFMGWLRDRIGARWPTCLGWALTAPLLWFLGLPGNWEGLGERAFIGGMVAMGFVITLFRGAGTFQLTATLHEMREKDPDVFGPGGGSSKIFSLTEISFNVGLILGPVVCGSLADTIGFQYMTWFLAGVVVFVSCTSGIFFTSKSTVGEGAAEEAT